MPILQVNSQRVRLLQKYDAGVGSHGTPPIEESIQVSWSHGVVGNSGMTSSSANLADLVKSWANLDNMILS
jgi:hypothetical protein